MSQRLGHHVDQVVTASGDEPLPFVALENIGSRTGSLLPDAELPLRVPEPTGMTWFREGDVLFSKLRPYLAKSWRADRTGVCSTELIVMRPRPTVDARWLGYLAQSDLLVEWAVATSEGVKMPRTSWEKLRLLELDAPSVAEQRAIADYLDAETARIDEVISAYRRELTLLALRKRATASEALARHSTDTVPVRRVVTKVTSGPRGWSGLEVEGSGQLFLRIANVPADSIDLKMDDVAYIKAPGGDESERSRVRPGDVLTTITAAIGQVAVVPRDLGEAYVSQHLALLRPNRALVSPEWLALALWSEDAQRQLDAARYGGTKQQLSLDDVREIRVPLADLTIQLDVANRIVASLDALTRAEQVIRRLTDLLLERRQALITAAVTGQLEIPGVAA